MKAFTTTLSVGLTPLLFSTQLQATSVAVPIANVQPARLTSSARSRGMSAEAVIKLKNEVTQKLSLLFSSREKLDKGIARLQTAVDNGQEVVLTPTQVKAATAIIGSAESAIEVAQGVFSNILDAEHLPCRASVESLRDETVSGLNDTINTMKKISKIAEQIADRQRTVIVIDPERMAIAINSDKIQMKQGMTREEKRQFILSQVS